MKYVKFGSQLPEAIHERFAELEYGEKRIACTGALLWYFTADEETKRLYREWARAIAEGFATIEEPPNTVATILRQKSPETGRGRKKTKR